MQDNQGSKRGRMNCGERIFFLVLCLICSVVGFIFAAQVFLKEPTRPIIVSQELESWETYQSGGTSGSYLFVYDEQERVLQITYKNAVEALDYHWYGKNAQVQLENGKTLPGRPAKTAKEWGDVVDYSWTTISPSFEVSVPFTESDLHKRINIRATMDVVYPTIKETDMIVDGVRYRVQSLTDATTSLEREYTLFVVTPDEVKWRKQYDTWKDRYVFICGSIGMLLLAAFWLFMALNDSKV